MFELPAGLSPGSSVMPGGWAYPQTANSLIAGQGGTFWFAATEGNKPGIARCRARASWSVSSPPNRGAWCPCPTAGPGSPQSTSSTGSIELGVVTKSGFVATTALAGPGPDLTSNPAGIAAGPDANLWYTDGTSTVVRVSGLDIGGRRAG